jgi:hypothetical protein
VNQPGQVCFNPAPYAAPALWRIYSGRNTARAASVAGKVQMLASQLLIAA